MKICPRKYVFVHANCLASLMFFVPSSFAASIDLRYETIRNVISEMYDDGTFGVEDYGFYTGDRKIYLQLCGVWEVSSRNYTLEDGINHRLESIAMQTEFMRRLLTETGFAKADWEPVIDQFEREAVALKDRNDDWFVENLVVYLADNLAPVGGRAITAEIGGECGDGGVLAEIVTDPPGGRIWISAEFDRRLCLAVGRNPDNLDDCGWREVTGSDAQLVAGTYRFFAQWSDGATSRGSRSFMDEAIADWENPYLVVMRK